MPTPPTTHWFESLPRSELFSRSAAWLRTAWDSLSGLSGQTELYSRFIGYAVPYSGTIGATVLELRPGFARTLMPDRKGIRNHIGSIHAIALCNLAELTGNLALAYGLPDDSRFIVTELCISYLKKAHGPIEGQCRCDIPSSSERYEYTLEVSLFDEQRSEVAHARVKTLVGPLKPRAV